MMASIIHGRLRLPAHIRLSVVALVGMVGLVWLLFFALGPRLHPTAVRTGGLAPAAGASGAANAPGRPLPHARAPGRDQPAPAGRGDHPAPARG